MSNNWTTADIPDLTGKVIFVTGANIRIGFEAAKEFARKGASHNAADARQLWQISEEPTGVRFL